MDISKYAVGPESYDPLSRMQISKFFSSHAPGKKDECDNLAAKLLGGTVSATPMQGGSSYTVERDETFKVVQFRFSKLDMERMGHIEKIYVNFVPQCVYHGMLDSLHVYIWDRVPGPAFCRVRRDMFTMNDDSDQRLMQAVQDFAR